MVPTFVALLGIPLDVTVLVDARMPEHQRLTRLAQRGYLANQRVVPIGEILQRPAADMEDLFNIDDYLAIYNAAFLKAHVSANLTGTDPIVSGLARAEGIDRFDRGKPADLFMRRRDQFLPALSEETLANFEAIIDRVNQTLLPK
jgi:hypothetical protein